LERSQPLERVAPAARSLQARVRMGSHLPTVPATTHSPSVNRRSLRSALDQLTRDFVDGILRAARSAYLADEAAREVPAALARRAPARKVRPLRSPRPEQRTRVPRKAKPVAADRAPDLVEPEEASPEFFIVDPAALLGAAASPRESARTTARAVASPLLTPSPSAAASPPTRPGEDFLRATSGTIVLRRRRSGR